MDIVGFISSCAKELPKYVYRECLTVENGRPKYSVGVDL